MIKQKKLLILINILFVFLFEQISYCMMIEKESPLPANCVIATRNTCLPTVSSFASASYGKMSTEEVYLVFAELARVISGNEEAVYKKLTEKLGVSFLANKAIQAFKSKKLMNPSTSASLLKTDKPAIVLFNEMFFGRDVALSKLEVDGITGCYRDFLEFFPNTYLYINFLYKDKFNPSYGSQIEISKQRYAQIQKKEVLTGGWTPFPSIWIDQHPYDPKKHYTDMFNGKYLDLVNSKDIASDIFAGELLLNQTKIFYKGEEIGFYNKSSFRGESMSDFRIGSTFKTKGIPFYVIGNFTTTWLSDHDTLLDNITNIICYDVDAMLGLSLPIPQKNFCFFASNTHTDFVASVKDRAEKHKVFDKTYICSDAEGRIGGIGGFVSIDADYSGAISGIFTASPALFPLTAVPPTDILSFQFPGSNYNMYLFSCK